MSETWLLAGLFLVVAALYGSVGHAGASGYLAVMALVGTAPERMKPTALVLNVVVATIATVNFRRAGVFYPRQVLPFALTSVPAAFLGGTVQATTPAYRPLVAVVLAAAAARALLGRPRDREEPAEPRAPWGPALGLGLGIGLLAGVTGTGGGIFLTPLLVFLGWASVRQSAGVSALFILVNSLAGLAGQVAVMPPPTVDLAVLAAAAGVGGFAGSWLGANRLPERSMSVALGVVLAIAAAKLAFG